MKKKLIILLSLVLILVTGCNNAKNTANNTTAGVKDESLVYTYLKQNFSDLTEKTFKEYIPFYVDLNKDGTMDVIYNTKEWYGELIYVLATENGYIQLTAKKNEIHKINDITVLNNFIVINGENISNGYNEVSCEINYLNDNNITFLHSFITKDQASTLPLTWNGVGQLKLADGYKQLEYSYEQYEEDISNNNKTLIKRINMSYSFDQENLKYIESENGENFDIDDNNPNDSSVLLTDLKNGDKVEEFTITDIYHDPKRSTSFTLSGDKWVNASLTYEAEGYEGYYFAVKEPIIDKAIAFGSDYANYHTTYDRPRGACILNETEVLKKYFNLAHFKHLEQGKTIEVYAHIKDPKVSVYYESEGGESVEILDLKITNESSIKKVEIPTLEGFKNETINETEIDYSQYRCVLIPEFTTINADKLDYQKVYFLENQNASVNCAVIGTLHDVTIFYKDYLDDPGTSHYYKELSNVNLSIRAPYTSDMAYVSIEGKIYTNGTEYKEVSVTIDTVSDRDELTIVKH